MRTPSSLLVAALAPLVALTLAGCTANAVTAIDGCVPVADPGPASKLVNVSGEVGSEPTITFPMPLYSEGLQRSVISEGEGATIPVGAQVHFQATILNGATGETIAATDYTDQGFARAIAGKVTNFGIALSCAREGERLALTGSALDVLGADALANAGFAPDLPLVLVFDVDDAFLGKADGASQLAVDGLPAIVTAVDGTPGITLPNYAPPTELTTTALKLGGGEKVEEGDRVVVNFTIWDWPSDGSPASILNTTWGDVASIFTADAAEMPEGFLAATLGTPVGSQVMVLTPATETEDARVMVLDVLGIMD